MEHVWDGMCRDGIGWDGKEWDKLGRNFWDACSLSFQDWHIVLDRDHNQDEENHVQDLQEGYLTKDEISRSMIIRPKPLCVWRSS